MYVCLSVGLFNVCECRHLKRPEEGTGSQELELIRLVQAL